MTATTPDIPTAAIHYAHGLYARVPEAEYHALHYASKHSLDIIDRKSPAHLHHERMNPQPTTDAMRLGSAFHALILQPDVFEQEWYAVGEKIDRRTTAGKQQWAEIVEQFGEDHVLARDEAETIFRMRKAVMAHPIAKVFGGGEAELSAFWQEPVTLPDGRQHFVQCKCRFDLLLRRKRTIIDLKTCDNASPQEFKYQIGKYSYHRQAAWYLDGAKQNDVDATDYVIVAVEKKEPHAVAVYRIDDASVAYGRTQNELLLRRYAECDANGTWPAYGNTVIPIGVDGLEWKERRLAEQMAQDDESEGGKWNK